MHSKTPRPRLLLAAGSMLSACWLLPAPAHACTPASCHDVEAAPSSGQTVPANVSAFPFSPAYGSYVVGGVVEQPANDPSGLLLLDAANAVVATKLVKLPFAQDYALVPNAELAQGAYHFRHLGASCGSIQAIDAGAESFADARPFTVGPSVPIPTNAGTVVANPPRFWAAGQMPVPDKDGICGPYLPAVSMVSLQWTPTAEMAAWRAVAKIEVTVDGAEWTSLGWGPTSASDVTIRHSDTVFTACGEDPSWPGHADPGVPEGSHTGTLVVWLPNQATPLPAVAFAFTTSCALQPGLDAGTASDGPGAELDSSIGSGGTTGSGGVLDSGPLATGTGGAITSGSGGTTGSGGVLDSGPPAQGGAPGPTESQGSGTSGCGCHIEGPSRGNGAGMFFAFLAVFFAAALRRSKS